MRLVRVRDPYTPPKESGPWKDVDPHGRYAGVKWDRRTGSSSATEDLRNGSRDAANKSDLATRDRLGLRRSEEEAFNDDRPCGRSIFSPRSYPPGDRCRAGVITKSGEKDEKSHALSQSESEEKCNGESYAFRDSKLQRKNLFEDSIGARMPEYKLLRGYTIYNRCNSRAPKKRSLLEIAQEEDMSPSCKVPRLEGLIDSTADFIWREQKLGNPKMQQNISHEQKGRTNFPSNNFSALHQVVSRSKEDENLERGLSIGREYEMLASQLEGESRGVEKEYAIVLPPDASNRNLGCGSDAIGVEKLDPQTNGKSLESRGILTEAQNIILGMSSSRHRDRKSAASVQREATSAGTGRVRDRGTRRDVRLEKDQIGRPGSAHCENARSSRQEVLVKEGSEAPARRKNSIQSVAIDFTDKFKLQAPLVIKEKPIETDLHRLSQRQKQIDYGKNTLGYERFIDLVPRWKRKKTDPQTPDINAACSKRAWEGNLRKWRRLLHVYDPPMEDDEEVAEDFTKRGLEGCQEDEAAGEEGAICQADDLINGKKKEVKDKQLALSIYDDWQEMET